MAVGTRKIPVTHWGAGNSMGLGVVIGLGTEPGQYFVQRDLLLIDLMANILGIAIASIGFVYLTK